MTEIANMRLELGDVIKIQSPANKVLHEQTYYISYIDFNTHTTWINLETTETLTIRMSKGRFDSSASIEQIQLISRSTEKGFAKQNNLILGTWIDIQFGGDTPFIITGLITDLEEDMIEITNYVPEQSGDKMYIDFAYKGIPEHLPIKNICIRDKPLALQEPDKEMETPSDDEDESQGTLQFNDDGTLDITLPETAKVQKPYREKLIDEQNESPESYDTRSNDSDIPGAYVNRKSQKYQIDAQLNDLYNEMLSAIPEEKRTLKVIRGLELHVKRFQELRQQFSLQDGMNRIIGRKPPINPNTHRPLGNAMIHQHQRVPWIYPVVTQKTKVYDIYDNETENRIIPSDVVNFCTGMDIKNENSLRNTLFYKNTYGQTEYVQYEHMQKSAIGFLTPFDTFTSDYFHTFETSPTIDVDTIVANFVTEDNEFESTHLTYEDKQNIPHNSVVSLQRYNNAITYFPEVRKKVTEEQLLMPADNMHIHSFLFMPSYYMSYGKQFLPMSSIYEKSNNLYDRHLYGTISLYHKKIHTFEKSIIENENDRNENDRNNRNPILPHSQKIQHLVLHEKHKDDSYDNIISQEEKTYVQQQSLEKLNEILPSIFDVIDYTSKQLQNIYSMHTFINELEPFLYYYSDLTAASLKKLRYFLLQNQKTYLQQYVEKKKSFQQLLTEVYKNKVAGVHGDYFANRRTENTLHKIEEIFSTEPQIKIRMDSSYKLSSFMQSSSMLYNIYLIDDGKMFTHLIKYMASELMNEDDFFKDINTQTAIMNEDDDGNKNEKAFTNDIDCNKKVLAKIYHSLDDLKEDNNKEITFDTTFDYTNYKLLDKYKEEQSNRSKEEFQEFLAERLIHDHNCPSRLAISTAQTIIKGTKFIEDGQYAKLIIYPELPGNQDETTLTEQEKSQIEIEKNVRKKETYYVRKRDNWVYDDSINEYAFTDTNVIFCNLNETCYKKDDKNMCENIEIDTKERMIREAKEDMNQELLSRYDKHVGENKQKIDNALHLLHETMFKIQYIKELRQLSANNYAVNLGKSVDKVEKVLSPYWKYRNNLFHHSVNFARKQELIIDFYQNYCREPLQDETQGWKYCFETNTQLLESSLYTLALAYVNGTYMKTLDMICKKQGILSDDGDKVMDRESGCELRKIEYSEAGTFLFALDDETNTEDAYEDQSDIVVQKLKKVKTKKNELMYDDKDLQDIYGLLQTICVRTFVPIDSVEIFVMNMCDKLLKDTKVVKSKTKYEKDLAAAQKDENKKKTKALPYHDYLENKKIEILGASILVAVQTIIPSFQTKKYERSCAYSFEGYPIDNSHRKGITYISCVLRLMLKTKKIISQKEGVLEERIYAMLEKHFMTKENIQFRYQKKRDYVQEESVANQIIPKTLDVSVRWTRFLPPLVDLNVLSKGLRFVSSTYHTELLDTIKKGHKDQWQMSSTYNGKMQIFICGLIELIQNILQRKDTLLNTMTNIPYHQNACCNEVTGLNPLQYFAKEDDRVAVYVKTMFTASRLIKQLKTDYMTTFLHEKRIGPILVDKELQAKSSQSIYMNLDKHIMYKTMIHFCKYDYDNHVLPNDLKTICQEKPETYDPRASLEEKIELLSETNNHISKNKFTQMMAAVQRRGLMRPSVLFDINWHAICTSELQQLFDNLEGSGVFDKTNVIDAFHTLLEQEDMTETVLNGLNNALHDTNQLWSQQLLKFMKTHYKKEPYSRVNRLFTNMMDTFFNKNEDMSLDRIHYYTLAYVKHISCIYPLYIGTPQRNKGSNLSISEHWKLTKEDASRMWSYYNSTYDKLNSLKGDEYNVSLSTILVQVQNDLDPILHLFKCIIQMIPHHLQTNKKLLTRCYMFFTLLVFKTFMVYSEDAEILMKTNQKMSVLRKTQRAQYDAEEEEENDEEIEEMTEVLLSNSRVTLQESLGELFYAYIECGIHRSQHVHFKSYENIMTLVDRAKEIEKNRVKKYYASLQNQSVDLLRAELVMKRMNLGKYFINQKDLITYGKNIENFYESQENNDETVPVQDMVNELLTGQDDENNILNVQETAFFEQLNDNNVDPFELEDELLMQYDPLEEDDDNMDIYQYGD